MGLRYIQWHWVFGGGGGGGGSACLCVFWSSYSNGNWPYTYTCFIITIPAACVRMCMYICNVVLIVRQIHVMF